MLALFKQSKVSLAKTFQRSCVSAFSRAGSQFRVNQSQFECATPNLRAFSTAEDALSREQQIEEGIRKLENEPFDFDWQKLNGLNTKALAEKKEELQSKVEENLLSSDESAAKYEQLLKKKLGPNYYRFKNRIHRETYAGFNDGFAPRPHKFNLFDRANNASIPPSADYVVPFNPFEEFLSRLTYIDYNNGRVRQEWKLEHQNVIHYNQLFPDMKKENYLADKPHEYLLIHNIPKDASRLSLYKLVSSFGPVTDFRVRSNLLGELAFVEVMYNSAVVASRAKRELYRQKFNNATLYPTNYEEAARESPERRTLVISNLDPSWDKKKVLYELSNFGNVMDIQVPTKFANGKLPSRKEILNHISLLKLEGPQKDRVRIREHVYDVNEYGLVTYEEKTLRLPEVADYVHNLEEVFDEEKSQTMTPKEFRDRFEKEQQNKNRKFYLEEIAGAFPNYFYCADYTKIQHLLDSNVAQSSEYTPEQKLNRISLTEKQILEFKQKLFSFQEQNRGYCFVTFASEDDAKKAIIQCSKSSYAKGPLSTDLKLNTNHVDWDSETFHDYMKTHDYQLESVREKIVSEHHGLANKEEFLRKKEEHYETSFGDQLEQTFYEAQVPKSNLSEAQLTPQQIREKYSHLDQQLAKNSTTSLRDNEIYQAVKDEFFVEAESPKIKLEGLGSDRHQVGRVKRSEVTERDYIELMGQLRSTNKDKGEISQATKEYFDELDKLRDPRILRELLQANEELAAFETSTDLQRADKLREKVRKMSKEWQDEEISKQVQEFEDKYFKKGLQKEQQLQKSRQRSAADAEKRKNRKRVFETNIKDFSTRRELDSNSNMQLETERSLRELKFKAVKMHTGKLTEQDLDQLYRTRVENYENNLPQDPHFLVRDPEGALFITEADVRRFEEDLVPEDPAERVAYEEAKREHDEVTKQIEQEAPNGVDLHKEMMMPATLAMLKHGIPVESFHFKPNEQFSEIESYIAELNKLDEVYSYAKEKDENGKEVIVKLIKPKYKYDIEKIIEYTPEKDREETIQTFRSKGIEIDEASLEDLNNTDIKQTIQDVQNFLSRTDHSEEDLKLIDVLQSEYPEAMEAILTGELFPDKDRFMNEIGEQAYIMQMEDKMRALTKEDILKYRSTLFNLKNEQGKMYRSRYSKV